jgi:AAA domain/3'-5' exonuclease/Domain of unknown function (DUF3854)
MGSAGWLPVTEESPCHVCGKSDWCSVSADGKKAICRRKDDGTGVRRTDKSGQDYWLYELNGHRELILSEDVSQQDGEVPEKADPQTLDQVYGALLDALALSHAHRQDLHRRGLTEAYIKRSGYRTLPLKGREALARTLVEHFGAEVCSQVPGLYENEAGRWSVAGATGMLVPVRNIEGRILALKIRADEGSRYTYLSSTKYGGPGPGSQVHVPLHDELDLSIVRLTEGELKADVTTALAGMLTVSTPGVSSWRQALEVASSLGSGVVHLAFDADAKQKEQVARALRESYRTLKERGFEVLLETWPRELGKGIDNLLAAGHEPTLLAGEDAHAAVNEIMLEATGVWRILKNAVSATELLAIEFPEPRWIVPGIVPEGTTILAGKPKMGKSWLALGTSVAVAAGGVALGTKRVERGAVLYLALEDNPRRLQSRLKKLLPGGAAPEGLELATEWRRLGDGGLEALEAWFNTHPDARLVVIDTLAKFRAGQTGKNLYKEDYEAVEPLVELAARHNVAILIVHHLRKLGADDPLDQVSGSMGLTGGADGALVLNRQRGRADAYLYVTGRDIEEEKELALSWDSTTATWKIAGDAEEYRNSRERQEVEGCLRTLGEPAGPKEVSEALGKPYNNVKQLMWKMGNDGDLRSVGGGKYVPVTDNRDNRDNHDQLSSLSEDDSASSIRDNVRSNEESADPGAVIPVTEVTVTEGLPDDGEPPPLITTEHELRSVTNDIRSAEVIGIDLETTGLNPCTDKVRLISLSTAEGSWLIDCFRVDPYPLFSVLSRKKLVMHNGMFDLGFMSAMGFEIEEGAEILDTMLLSRILEDKENT